MLRFHTVKLLAAVLTGVATLIALPALAQADSRHRHRHDHRAHAVPVYRHGAHCASRHVHPAAHRRAAAAHPYRCRPCSRRFATWQSLRQHAHHHHRVSPWRFAGLLVRSGPLWIFLG
jgi:hypothetical protein